MGIVTIRNGRVLAIAHGDAAAVSHSLESYPEETLGSPIPSCIYAVPEQDMPHLKLLAPTETQDRGRNLW